METGQPPVFIYMCKTRLGSSGLGLKQFGTLLCGFCPAIKLMHSGGGRD